VRSRTARVMKTLMRNGRDRRSENPRSATRGKNACFWLGPISGSHQGQQPNGCTQRPDTWLHPNASRKSQILFPCTAGAVHTWHFDRNSDGARLDLECRQFFRPHRRRRHHRRAGRAHDFEWRRRECQRDHDNWRFVRRQLAGDGHRGRLGPECVQRAGDRWRLWLQSGRHAHDCRRRFGQFAQWDDHWGRQHAQPRHRRARRSDRDPFHHQRWPDRGELHRYAHARRRDLRQWRAEQVWRWHAHSLRHQHLYRHHQYQRRHAAGSSIRAA
jgi:hypothetical protein